MDLQGFPNKGGVCMGYQKIWDRIRDLTIQERSSKRALIERLKDEYGSFDTVAKSLSKYIIKTGFCARIGRYNLYFLGNKGEGYELRVANNLIYWAKRCYPLLKWYDMVWGKIHREIIKTYDCLCTYIKSKYGIKYCPKLGFRKSWTSTSRTYIIFKEESKINIGVLGVLEESKHHRFDEYSTVARVLFKNPIKYGKVYSINFKPDEYYLTGVLALTHEIAHFVANTIYPYRKDESGERRARHDIVFLNAYSSLLNYLAENCYPELRKYIRQKV